MSISPEGLAALSRYLAQELVREVVAAGGGIADVLTVSTATAARVLCMALPEEADGHAVEKMCRMIAETLPVLRRSEREGSVG